MRRKKERYKFTDKNHSRRGIISCIDGGIAFLLTAVSLAYAYITAGNAGRIVAIAGIAAAVLAGCGLYYGLLAIKEEYSYKIMPGVGIGINVILLLVCLEIYILGW